jgi:nuclear transcription Y subunit beta
MKEKRKTINGDDLIWSMGTLGFEDYVEPLKLYLKLYREVLLPLFSLNTLPGRFYLITLYRELILHRLFALGM